MQSFRSAARARRPHACAALAAPLAAAALTLGLPSITRAVDPPPVWVIQRIATSGDGAPNSGADFLAFGQPAIDGDSVVFQTDLSNGTQAVYAFMNANLLPAALETTPVPGHPALTFSAFDIPVGVNADDAFFSAGFPGGDGLYRTQYPAARSLIADVGDAAPPSGSFTDLSPSGPSADLGEVAFRASVSGGVTGLYLFDGAAIERITDTTVTPPGGAAGAFTSLSFPSLRAHRVAFSGVTPSGDALYKWSSGALSEVADESTAILNSAGVPTGQDFGAYLSPAIDALETIAFVGQNNAAMVRGVYRVRPGGVPLPVADLTTAAPDGGGNFTDFGTVCSIDMNGVVFTGFTATESGLYTDLGSSLKTVLLSGEMLDGKTVSTVRISNQALSKNVIAFEVEFGDDSEAIYTATLLTVPTETEPNNDAADANTIEVLCDPQYVSGKLQENGYPECRPDTFLVVFDKQGNRINESNDDPCKDGTPESSSLENLVLYVPPGAPVFGNGGSGFVNNGDGTRSLRLGVTGYPDGFDGNFDGMFTGSSSNTPHAQTGGFTVCITWKDAGAVMPSPVELPDGTMVSNPQMYPEEFFGGDAFRLNFTVPTNADSVDVCVDNSTGRVPVCNDVDFLLFTNLIPNCPYCVEQVGGLTDDCEQTDGLLGWIGKSINESGLFTLLDCDDDGGEGVFPALCGENQVIADANGRVLIGLTGTGDKNFNGLKDSEEGPYLDDHPEYLDEYPGVKPIPPGESLIDGPDAGAVARAPTPDCVDLPPGHMICGCWVLCITLEPHDTLDPDEMQRLADAMHHGDMNMDGVTDTADIGLLLGWFGWIGGN